MAKIANDKLTDKEYFFCHEYAKTLNATQAYQKAGYKSTTNANDRAMASQLLAKPHIKLYIAAVFDLSTVNVLNEIIDIAFAQITDVLTIDESGAKVKHSKNWAKRSKVAVKSVKIRTRTINHSDGGVEIITETEVVMHDKIAALDRLFKKLGMTPRNDSVIEAIESMANHGLLVPKQAEVVKDGIERIRESLQGLSTTTSTIEAEFSEASLV